MSTQPEREERTVEIIEDATEKVVKRLGPYASRRLAEKAMNGVLRQLDHENFSVRLVK